MPFITNSYEYKLILCSMKSKFNILTTRCYISTFTIPILPTFTVHSPERLYFLFILRRVDILQHVVVINNRKSKNFTPSRLQLNHHSLPSFTYLDEQTRFVQRQSQWLKTNIEPLLFCPIFKIVPFRQVIILLAITSASFPDNSNPFISSAPSPTS